MPATRLSRYGWAVDDSGIAAVEASADGGPPLAMWVGQEFPGVAKAYPAMPGSDHAGYGFLVPSLPPGPHTLRVTFIARDGGRTTITRGIVIATSAVGGGADRK